MSEERKYTGFAAIYQIEQEKLKREKAQPPQSPSGESEDRAAGQPAPAEPYAEERREVREAPPDVEGESSDSPTEAAPAREAAPAELEPLTKALPVKRSRPRRAPRGAPQQQPQSRAP